MPYQAGVRLSGERASRLGHLDVLNSELVRNLVKEFEARESSSPSQQISWEPYEQDLSSLPLIFGIDGSYQEIQSELPPYKKLGFVKTAIIRLDRVALSKIDPYEPHPLALRDLLKDSAIYHATVFPLKHVSIPGSNIYVTVRKVIYESIKDDSLKGEPMETLKWLAFEKWDGKQKSLPKFECPHCHQNSATLDYNEETGKCKECNDELYITDMLGFHLDMNPDSARDTVVNSYMSIHETLLLFTGIRIYWERHRDVLKRCLFMKDGPLSIRAQYSKLVNPIRRFLQFAKDNGTEIYVLGQEKSGRFWDHLEEIAPRAPRETIFIPGDSYIKSEIQSRPDTGAPYGWDTNYGAKLFLKLNEFHHSVLNIPVGLFNSNPKFSDLIGGGRILSTLPGIASSRFEGGFLPVELANGIASLSTYPSAQILRLFSDNSVN